jgi:COMPASS component SPP1
LNWFRQILFLRIRCCNNKNCTSDFSDFLGGTNLLPDPKLPSAGETADKVACLQVAVAVAAHKYGESMSYSSAIFSVQATQAETPLVSSENLQDAQMSVPPASAGGIADMSLPPTVEDIAPQAEGPLLAGDAMDTVEDGSEEGKAQMSPQQQHKKKGTARVVKSQRGGKSAGGSTGRKKGGGPGGRRKKAAASNENAAVNGAGEGGEGGGSGADANANEDESESDQGTYCICHGPDDHRFMISCDSCSDWFHGDCVGMDKETGEKLVQQYVCPRCEEPRARHVTRYKKLCALPGCGEPSRIYNAKDPSVFCSKAHCDAWWEMMVSGLPKSKGVIGGRGGAATAAGVVAGDVLTQADFVGLLDRHGREPAREGSTWKLGDEPFAIEPSFWDKARMDEVLTEEERLFVTASSQDRRALQEEVVLCKKQLQLLDMAAERRKQLIVAAGASSNKDMCGYDYNLDAVGSSAAFAALEKSARGQAIFAAGRLDPPPQAADEDQEDPDPDVAKKAMAAAWASAGPPPSAAGDWTCRAKRCKPHGAWYNSMVKGVRHTIKQLTGEAKEKLEAEVRMQECAAVRYQRRAREANWVEEIVDTDD